MQTNIFIGGSSDSDDNTGAIIGIVVGVICGAIVVVVVIIIVIYCCWYRKDKESSKFLCTLYVYFTYSTVIIILAVPENLLSGFQLRPRPINPQILPMMLLSIAKK